MVIPRLVRQGETMRTRNAAPQMVEAYGVPTYHVTNVVQEDAGNGIVRIFLCEKRNGTLFPHCEVIVAAATSLLLSQQCTDFALGVFSSGLVGSSH